MPCVPERKNYLAGYEDTVTSVAAKHGLSSIAEAPPSLRHEIRVEAAKAFRPVYREGVESKHQEESGQSEYAVREWRLDGDGHVVYSDGAFAGTKLTEFDERTKRLTPEQYNPADAATNLLIEESFRSGARQVVTTYHRDGADNRDVIVMTYDRETNTGKLSVINTAPDGRYHTFDRIGEIAKQRFAGLNEVKPHRNVFLLTDTGLADPAVQRQVADAGLVHEAPVRVAPAAIQETPSVSVPEAYPRETAAPTESPVRTEPHKPYVPIVTDIGKNIEQTAESVAMYRRRQAQRQQAGQENRITVRDRAPEPAAARHAVAETRQPPHAPDRRMRPVERAIASREAGVAVAITAAALIDRKMAIPVAAVAGIAAMDAIRRMDAPRPARRRPGRAPERRIPRLRPDRIAELQRHGAAAGMSRDGRRFPRPETGTAVRRDMTSRPDGIRAVVPAASFRREPVPGRRMILPDALTTGVRRRKGAVERPVPHEAKPSVRLRRETTRATTRERKKRHRPVAEAGMRMTGTNTEKKTVRRLLRIVREPSYRLFRERTGQTPVRAAGMEARPAEPRRHTTAEKRRTARQFTYALAVWMLLTHLPAAAAAEGSRTPGGLPPSAGAERIVSQTTRQDGNSAENPTAADDGSAPAWLMLAIVRYLAMVREQGKATYVKKKKKPAASGAATGTGHPAGPADILPREGLIFSYGH